MGSKMLTGSMLVFGPILAIIMLFVEPGGMEDEAAFSVIVQSLLDNSTLGEIAAVGWPIALLATTIGTAYLARSMQGEQKIGSDLAGLASVLAFLSAGIVAVSSGIQMAIFDTEWVDQGGDITNAWAIGEGAFRSMFMFMGAASLLLGIAIFRQKNLNQIAGGITGLFGALLLVGWIIPVSGDVFGTIGFIGFLGWPIMTIVLGVLTILSARKDALGIPPTK